MNRQTIHRGAVAAGDPQTLAIEEACACAKLELIAYPVRVAKQTPGQTMSVTALTECLKLYGRDTLVTAFQCVTESSNGEEPDLLVAPVIKALCDVPHYRKDRRDAGEALMGAFDQIDLASHAEAARLTPKAKGISTAMVLTAQLNDHLNRVPALTRKAA